MSGTEQASEYLAIILREAAGRLAATTEETRRMFDFADRVSQMLAGSGTGDKGTFERLVPIGPWAHGAGLRPLRIASLLVLFRSKAPDSVELAVRELYRSVQGRAAFAEMRRTSVELGWQLDSDKDPARIRLVPVYRASAVAPNEVFGWALLGGLVGGMDGALVGGGLAAIAADKGRDKISVPTAKGWKAALLPHLPELFQQANAHVVGLARELLILVQAWNRAQGHRINETQLYETTLNLLASLDDAPADLAMLLVRLFSLLANAFYDMSNDASDSLILRAASDTVKSAGEMAARGFVRDASGRLRRLFGESALPPESTAPILIEFELDVLGPSPREEFADLLENAAKNHAEHHVIHLSEEVEEPKLPLAASPLQPSDWKALARGVVRMVERAKTLVEKQASTYVIHGRAQLPVFTHLGMTLARETTGEVVVLDRGPDGRWQHFSPHSLINAETIPVFDAVSGLKKMDPSPNRGRVAVVIRTAISPFSAVPISEFFSHRDIPLAGWVDIRSAKQTSLSGGDMAAAGQELIQRMRELRVAYPAAEGIVLFVSGSAPLAFVAGWALDPGILGTVLTPAFDEGRFEDTFSLPWRDAGSRERKARLLVDSLSLEAFRGLGSMEIDFDSRFTVLAGRNGRGKTSILDCLARMLSWFFATLAPRRGPVFADDDIQNDESELYVRLSGAYNGKPVSWSVKRTRGRGSGRASRSREKRPVSELRQIHEALAKRVEENGNLPLAVYYAVNRSDLDVPTRSKKLVGDRIAKIFENALIKGQADFRGFFNWFKEREDEENAEKRRDFSHEDRKLRAVRRALESVLDGFREPHIERRPLRMVVHKGRQELSINQLSDGERSVMAMVGDLARRLCDANPGLIDPLEGSAIVLIDELELHLHPDWQRRLIPDLTRTFPACQFIATTHSPQVLGHIPANAVRLLHTGPDGHTVAKPVDGAYGLDSNLILEELLGVAPQAEEVKNEIDEIYELIEMGEFDEANRRRVELARKIGPGYPEFARMEMRLRRLRSAGS